MMGVLRCGQERFDLGHAQKLGQGLLGKGHYIVCHGLAPTGIYMRKEARFTLYVAFFVGEGHTLHPPLLLTGIQLSIESHRRMGNPG
ncbi:hypothetical protein VC35_15525 [Pseudomonas fluorescens]|uniref:Uncharacterized protein n=1 Tax=Pseudomonas fluorescens TaxID=294 RepID=A0A0F4TNB0_PSEFL|nr:hypothetical protein VC35_15525 [Pseudomonas fluorescens]